VRVITSVTRNETVNSEKEWKDTREVSPTCWNNYLHTVDLQVSTCSCFLSFGIPNKNGKERKAQGLIILRATGSEVSVAAIIFKNSPEEKKEMVKTID